MKKLLIKHWYILMIILVAFIMVSMGYLASCWAGQTGAIEVRRSPLFNQSDELVLKINQTVELDDLYRQTYKVTSALHLYRNGKYIEMVESYYSEPIRCDMIEEIKKKHWKN